MVLIRQQRRDVAAVAQAKAECRLYDRLFTKADPEDVGPVTSPGDSLVGTAGPAVRSNFMVNINPHSLDIVAAKCEPAVAEAMAGRPGLKDAKPELRYQFERLGYFALDQDTGAGKLACQAEAPSSGRRLVFNRTITLKDTWVKEAKKGN
jgi:glutaminyl-tRNA synthetase